MRVLGGLTVLLAMAAASHITLGELDSGFDNLVEQLLALFHVPGLSLAVIRDDEIASKVCLDATLAT